MGRRVTSLVVERSLFTVLAPGIVSSPECATDPTDCCSSGSGSGSACCVGSGGLPESTAIVFDGPIESSCGNGTASGLLSRIESVGQAFDLTPAIDLGGGGSITATLYCAGTQWRLNGTITIYGMPDRVFYDIALSSDPDLGLVGSIEIPGCDDPVVVAVDIRCVGSGSGSVSTPCVPSEAPTSLIANVAGNGDCACYSGDYNLVYSAANTWISTSSPGTCGGVTPAMVLQCTGSNWVIRIECPSGTLSLFQIGADASVASPFSLTFNGGGGGIANSGASTCCTNGVASITVHT